MFNLIPILMGLNCIALAAIQLPFVDTSKKWYKQFAVWTSIWCGIAAILNFTMYWWFKWIL